MFNVKILPNPARLHYFTPNAAGVPTYEIAKSVATKPLVLLNLYAFNSDTANDLFLAVFDSPDGTQGSAATVTVYPVPKKSFVQVATPGGDRFEKGLFVKAFTDVGLTTAAGAVMAFKIDYTPYIE
jgi:hypothetical protein